MVLGACGSDTTGTMGDPDGALADTTPTEDTSGTVDTGAAVDTGTAQPDGGADSAVPPADTGTVEDSAAPDAPVPPPDGPVPPPDVPVRPDAPIRPDAPVPPDGTTMVTRCGTRGLPPCPMGQFCNFPPRAMCGATDLGGTCETPPMMCSRDMRPVCGCDGHDYTNPCEAARARQSVAREGRCMTSMDGGTTDAPTMTDTRPATDTSVTPDASAPGCAAQDAHGMGGCDRVLGYVWDGSMCRALSGCSCTGTACGALYRTMDGCVAEHRMCTVGDCRTRGCPDGRTCSPCRATGGVVYICLPRGATC
jgi:hypothetical protein